jgi:ribosomal protein S21
MPVEIKKQQQRESSQSLIRRFLRQVKQSGILIGARKNKFKTRPKSKQMKKRAALRREELRIEYEKIRKLGK